MRKQKNKLKKEINLFGAQTIGEEIANSITHGLGAVLSTAALVILVVLARANAAMPGAW